MGHREPVVSTKNSANREQKGDMEFSYRFSGRPPDKDGVPEDYRHKCNNIACLKARKGSNTWSMDEG